MLAFFRNNLKRFSIFLWIGVLAFVVGGAYLFVSGPFKMGSNTAIEVGKTKVDMPTYTKTYDNLYKFYTQMLHRIKGNNVTEDDIKKLDLKQKTVDLLIDRILLFNEAKKEGIKVTDKDVSSVIEQKKVFYNMGHFSKEKYLAILKANNINPKDYEISLKSDLYIDRLKNDLYKSITVSADDVKKYYNRNFSKIKVDYISMSSADFKNKIKYSTEDLKKYYNLHKESFRIPTKLKFKYALISYGYMESKTDVSSEEAKSFYDKHISYFAVPEQRKVSHVLLVKKKNETDEQFKKRAEKIYAKVKKGKSFAEMAKKYSQGPSKTTGGELGYIAKKMVIAPFWNAVSKMKVGEISAPFRTKFGYHIAKLEAVKPAHTRPFKDVKKVIIKAIKMQKAKDKIFIEAKKIFVKLRNSKKFDASLRTFNLASKTSNFMSMKKLKPPFTTNIIKNALLSSTNTLLGPDQSKNGYVIYKVLKKEESYIPHFKNIIENVKKAYVNDQSIKEAKKAFEKAYNMSLKNKDIKQTAKMLSLKTDTTKYFSKFSPDYTMPCEFSEKFAKTVFDKNIGFVGKCYKNNNFYLYQIKDKKINEKDLEKRKKEIKSLLKYEKQKDLLDKFITDLKKHTKIKVNPKL